jgi:hypothetical protein
VSETGEPQPKKPGFFARIFGGGGDSDQHKTLSKMDSLAAYVIREHRSGRPLDEILEDPYLKNRATDEQRLRLLERPDIIRAVGEDVASLAAEQVREP